MKGIRKTIRDNKYLKWLLVISNWCFQGILHADKTEKYFKMSFTIIPGIIIFFLFKHFLSINTIRSILLSFIISHTLNWIINGNFHALVIHRLLLVKLSKRRLFDYIETLEDKMTTQNWILYAASFGSICRGELKDSSDLDISIVRKPGIKNAALSILFSITEKKYADFNSIPLELYISDSPNDSIKRFAGEKNPIVLCDPEKIVDCYYTERLTIEEARVLNKLR